MTGAGPAARVLAGESVHQHVLADRRPVATAGRLAAEVGRGGSTQVTRHGTPTGVLRQAVRRAPRKGARANALGKNPQKSWGGHGAVQPVRGSAPPGPHQGWRDRVGRWATVSCRAMLGAAAWRAPPAPVDGPGRRGQREWCVAHQALWWGAGGPDLVGALSPLTIECGTRKQVGLAPARRATAAATTDSSPCRRATGESRLEGSGPDTDPLGWSGWSATSVE